ncbi:MAG: hypothetical protein U5K56_17760 [Halioglobus sp.]|nr:hypothetical protein [Halioglobus sp.]
MNDDFHGLASIQVVNGELELTEGELDVGWRIPGAGSVRTEVSCLPLPTLPLETVTNALPTAVVHRSNVALFLIERAVAVAVACPAAVEVRNGFLDTAGYAVTVCVGAVVGRAVTVGVHIRAVRDAVAVGVRVVAVRIDGIGQAVVVGVGVVVDRVVGVIDAVAV